MSPQLNGNAHAQLPAADTLECDVILSEFLHEMDALDQLQSLELPYFPMDQELDQKPSLDQPTPPPRKRRSTSWLRRKQELLALRNESKALELQMASLHLQRARNGIQATSDTVTDEQAMWKSVDAIARQECQNSQEENARLKSEILEYTCGIEILQAQLVAAESCQQQLKRSNLDFANTFRVGMITSQRLCFDNNEIYELLEQRINARFHELDAIVRETHNLQREGFTENVQVCRDDISATAVEFQHVRLLPFGGNGTATSVWAFINRDGLAKTNTYLARSTSDMVGLVSRHTVPLGSTVSVSVDVHTAIKRFAVATGMVALVESRSEWSIDHPTALGSRYTTEEGGWFIVHELPHQFPSQVTQRETQLKVSVKLHPKEPHESSFTTRSSLSSTVVDVVIPSFSDIMNSHLQSLENHLLDSSVRSAICA